MWPCLLSPHTDQVKEILEVRNDNIHLINVTLAANLISIKNIHCGTKSGNSLSQSVILGGLPVSNKNIMGRRLFLFDWCHPPPDCGLEGKGSILLYVFWMVQKINLQCLSSCTIVVVPIKKDANKNIFSITFQLIKPVSQLLHMWWERINARTYKKCYTAAIQKIILWFKRTIWTVPNIIGGIALSHTKQFIS